MCRTADMREMPVGLHASSLGGDLIEQGVGLLCYDAKGTSYIVVNTPKTSI